MANQVTTKDRIDYLIKRRFPLSYLLSIMPSISRGAGPAPDTRQLRQDVDAFRGELAALAPEELIARYDAEKGKELTSDLPQ